jgi:hypothetical protein
MHEAYSGVARFTLPRFGDLMHFWRNGEESGATGGLDGSGQRSQQSAALQPRLRDSVMDAGAWNHWAAPLDCGAGGAAEASHRLDSLPTTPCDDVLWPAR